MSYGCMTSKKTRLLYASRKDCSKPLNDSANRSALDWKMEKSHRDHPAECGDLLRLSLLSRDARRQSPHRFGDRFLGPDADFTATESGCHWLDHPQLFRLPGRRPRRDFSTGTAARPRRAGRTPDFFPYE